MSGQRIVGMGPVLFVDVAEAPDHATALPGETFPPLEEVFAISRDVWQWVAGLPLRRCGSDVCCPACRWYGVVYRNWRFGQRPSSHRYPIRCDVALKCARCACCWNHGIVVPPEQWEAWQATGRGLGTVTRSEVVEHVRQHG